ncbi:YdeI/OmpD-associated family protein [soil metagenome]
MKATGKKDFEILSFKTAKAFEKWLAKNHAMTDGIWIKFFKKDSGEKTLTYKEALDEALCYGWIDGQANKYDDASWIQKFTPRRTRSIWSKRNTEYIERLTKLGKIKQAGLAEVERAKADGRWEKAYDKPSDMTIPGDFLKKLSKDKKAKSFFESLNKTNKYAITWRLQTAKKPETREKRMNLILEMLSKGEKFH